LRFERPYDAWLRALREPEVTGERERKGRLHEARQLLLAPLFMPVTPAWPCFFPDGPPAIWRELRLAFTKTSAALQDVHYIVKSSPSEASRLTDILLPALSFPLRIARPSSRTAPDRSNYHLSHRMPHLLAQSPPV
jgi:hypothetical protein